MIPRKGEGAERTAEANNGQEYISYEETSQDSLLEMRTGLWEAFITTLKDDGL